jgi:EAL domain-containing protein (putative c-di-GMP-specific phosphodiesterase class I)/GGDEF domain-containing protein
MPTPGSHAGSVEDSQEQSVVRSDLRLPGEWEKRVAAFDYAFQPIVNVHTGDAVGFEALLRKHAEAGFRTIQDVFDSAYREGILNGLELRLREKAIVKYTRAAFHAHGGLFLNLFLNMDGRTLLSGDYTPGRTRHLLKQYAISPERVSFEISERHDVYTQDSSPVIALIQAYKRQGYRIALDDFGSGYSGLQQLYFAEPEFIKIDRFFISNIETDARKRLFVSKIIKMAHIMGIHVIGEGVETEAEFLVCHAIGCDYVQGYLVQRPTTDTGALLLRYEHIGDLVRNDRRTSGNRSDRTLLSQYMEETEPLALYTNNRLSETHGLIEYFSQHSDRNYIPIVGPLREPLGVVLERDLKEYVYSSYGRELLRNVSIGINIRSFITRCPICEVATSIDDIVAVFASEKDAAGILVSENGAYRGFLTARALLQILNEKMLAAAEDQNPLSRLPGNYLIQEHIAARLADPDAASLFVLFDFDAFKPFNDHYGFRRGDRAITLFADLVKKVGVEYGAFVGHIGGDDFFCAFDLERRSTAACIQVVRALCEEFRTDVAALYDPEDRNAGGIMARDRNETVRRFPLLSVSAAILEKPHNASRVPIDEVLSEISRLKLDAKRSPSHLAVGSLPAGDRLSGNGAARLEPEEAPAPA